MSTTKENKSKSLTTLTYVTHHSHLKMEIFLTSILKCLVNDKMW